MTLLASLLVGAGASACAGSLDDFPPAPRVIETLVFDDGSARQEAARSDAWPITWGRDDHVYAAFGGGDGFTGTGDSSGVGISRVLGDATQYTGEDIAGGATAPNPSPFVGTTAGLLALDDRLYLWRNGDAVGVAAYKFSRLYRSSDDGASWQAVGVEFSRDAGHFVDNDLGFFAPAFCQFGPGFTGTPDDYVYIYAPEINDLQVWNVQRPGRVSLMRVPRDLIETRSEYEFFAGLSAEGLPRWTRDLAARTPVWTDADGTQRMAVSYNPALERYLLSTVTIDRDGRIAVFEARWPWGPFVRVFTEQNVARWGSDTILFSFVNKWLSADGLDFVIVHSKDDSWATIAGHFQLR